MFEFNINFNNNLHELRTPFFIILVKKTLFNIQNLLPTLIYFVLASTEIFLLRILHVSVIAPKTIPAYFLLSNCMGRYVRCEQSGSSDQII